MASILILDTYYPRFLESPQVQHLVCESANYDENLTSLMKLRFGISDVYSTELENLGWQAREVIPNLAILQQQWASENGGIDNGLLAHVPPNFTSRIPVLRNIARKVGGLTRILHRQIAEFAPDFLYFQDLNVASPGELRQWRSQGIRLIGQIASPLPSPAVLREFDLIFSSLPNQVEQLRNLGCNAEFLQIAFDARVLDEIGTLERDLTLTFVGGLSRNHLSTEPLLNTVYGKHQNLQIFGYGSDSLPKSSNLRHIHMGEVWGKDMYRVIGRSKITINRHISVAGSYANNMRLFEATGMGALLLTDRKLNLDDYFEDGKEVLAYESPEHASELIGWALEHEIDAQEIARAGQSRTLRDHTYPRVVARIDEVLRSMM